jgi:hypothetical protein
LKKRWLKLSAGLAAGLALGLIYSFVSRSLGST